MVIMKALVQQDETLPSYIFQYIMIFKGILKIHPELAAAFCKEWLEKPQTATNSKKEQKNIMS